MDELGIPKKQKEISNATRMLTDFSTHRCFGLIMLTVSQEAAFTKAVKDLGVVVHKLHLDTLKCCHTLSKRVTKPEVVVNTLNDMR